MWRDLKKGYGAIGQNGLTNGAFIMRKVARLLSTCPIKADISGIVIAV